jgi:tryptophan 2,3-dioxygenase
LALTYGSYIQIEALLRLQEPKSSPAEHDEMLFIVIHQVYELWFKLMLHELDKVRRDFSANDLWGAVGTFKRCTKILKTLVGQLDVLETMTPLSFLSFRDRLDTASGFQSAQFRELEFVLGHKRAQVVRALPNEIERARLEQRLTERSVVDHFYDFLGQRGLTIPAELLTKDVREPTRPSEALQGELLRAYKAQPDLVILLELITDFDEGLQEWRYRHIKMAERTIGAKRGTGGSYGVDFLKQTLFTPLFPDIWAVRHKM